MSRTEKSVYDIELSRALFGSRNRLPILRAIGKYAVAEPPQPFAVKDILEATLLDDSDSNLNTTQRMIHLLDSAGLVKVVERLYFPTGKKIYEPVVTPLWPAINGMLEAAEVHFSQNRHGA